MLMITNDHVDSKQIHSPVHFVVRNDGNDRGDTDAVCEAIPE